MEIRRAVLVVFLYVLFYCTGFGETDSQSIKFENEIYNIETRWIDTTALKKYAETYFSGALYNQWSDTNSAFVRDDMLYFTKMSIDGMPCDDMLEVSGATGTVVGTVSIDWNGFSHSSLTAAVYAGKDSEGTCFVASYGTNISADYPFDIFPLSFKDDGKPVVEGKYNLEMGSGRWFVQSPSILGNLLNGNFSVAAPVWDDRNPMDNAFKTSICIWKFSDGEYIGKQVFPVNLTVADVQLIADDRLAVDDRHLWYSNEVTKFNIGDRAIAEYPTLYNIENGTLTENSSIAPASGDDGNGNGMAFFSLGTDNHFMIYASSGNQCAEFKLVSLPQYPQSFDGAKQVCVLTPKSASLSSDVEPNDNMLQTKIFLEQPDTNKVNVFVAAHNKGMAAYTIMKESSISTDIELNISENHRPTEYFDLTGRRLLAPPVKGFYIIKNGSKTVKAFIH